MRRQKMNSFEAVMVASRDADEHYRMRKAAAAVAQIALEEAQKTGALVEHVISILEDHARRVSMVDLDDQPEQMEPEDAALDARVTAELGPLKMGDKL